MITDLNRSLGSRQFLNVGNERTHVLQRARAHIKVPGCSLVQKALLIKKLAMFLSRLNELNGGCERRPFSCLAGRPLPKRSLRQLFDTSFYAKV